MRLLPSLFLGLAVLCLTFAPVAAPSAEPIVIAQAETGGGVDVSGELESTGSSVTPPSDAEIFRVKGRAVTAIETEVPTSATQFDAKAIEALGAQSVSDLAKVTPNVEITTTGATTPTFFIRGVGLSDFNANAPGAVAIYQDDVAINAPAIQLGQLYDIERVDILRGPQGDGAGRNASGGAIKVYSRKPTGERSATLRVDYGNYRYVDVEGAVEAPLNKESSLQTRLSFRYSSADGYTKNGCAGIPSYEERGIINAQPPARRVAEASAAPFRDVTYCGESDQPFLSPIGNIRLSPVPGDLPNRVNNLGRWAARGFLRYQPPDTEMDFLLNFHGGRIDQLSTLGQAIGTQRSGFGQPTRVGYTDKDITEIQNSLINSGLSIKDANTALGPLLAENLDTDPYRGDYNRVGDTTLDTWGTFLRADVPIGDAHLTSISGYEEYTRFRETDTDFTPDVLFEIIRDDSAWQASQDIRLSGEMDNTPLKWETGAFYLMQKLKSDSDFFLFGNVNSNQVYSEDTYSFGVFGGFTWEFLDDFTLHAGGRYNWEHKEFQVTLSRITPTGELNVQRAFPKREETWSAPTGTVSLAYRFSDTVNMSWKYSRGWKGGHFNAASAAGRETFPADPETIDAFEIALQGRWFDGRMALSANVFYYGYYDYQVFITKDQLGSFPQLQVINANNAEVYGLEADLRIEPIDRLIVTTRFGWLESTFLDFTDTVIRITNDGIDPDTGVPLSGQLQVTNDFSGNRLISSPQFKASLSAEYTLDLGRFGALIPRYDASWTDDVYFDASEGEGSIDFDGETSLPPFATGQRAFWLHNLRLTYRTPEGNMELSAWVRNLTDQAYKNYAFDASTFAEVTINFIGAPRTYGGSVSFSW